MIWKKISLILSLLICCVLVFLAIHRQKNRRVSELEISIKPQNVLFVSQAYIRTQLEQKMGGSLLGRPLNHMDMHAMETHLNKVPWVQNAEMYHRFGSVLAVKVDQRIPLLRLEPEGRSAYYLDIKGFPFPLSKSFAARVPVVTGSFDSSMHSKLYTLGIYVHESPVWKGQIQQIFVKNNNNLILSPTIGAFVIEFGAVERLEEKFENLAAFYRQVLPKKGWTRYKEVSVRYKGQVIGRSL